MRVEGSREPGGLRTHGPGGGAQANDPAPFPEFPREGLREERRMPVEEWVSTGTCLQVAFRNAPSLFPSKPPRALILPRSQVLSVTNKDKH